MLVPMLFLAGTNFLNGNPPGTGGANPFFPTKADVSWVTKGACRIDTDGSSVLDTPAIFRVSWTITNPDNLHYETHILQDGAMLATVPSSATFFDVQMDGVVGTTKTTVVLPGGDPTPPFNVFQMNSIFTVKVIRLADLAVMSSVDSQPWVANFGTCSP